ncbi:36378_t:CDS:1, partial [Racocetra persica]
LTTFYDLARLGELLPNSQHNITKVPTLQALKFEKTSGDTFVTIQLAKMKNHKSANRISLVINPTNDSLCPCPVCALKSYTQLRTQASYAKHSTTLFIKQDGTWATKYWFVSKLKKLLPHEDIAGHSFQAEGTTELVSRGVQL